MDPLQGDQISDTPDRKPAAEMAGANGFVANVKSFISRCLTVGSVDEKCPTIVTRKHRFAPVLANELLRKHPIVHTQMLERDGSLRVAHLVGDVLGDLEHGRIIDAVGLRRALFNISGPRLRFPEARFELLYGALQLLAYAAVESGDQLRAADIFAHVAEIVYALCSKNKNEALHVEHFLAHAAVFLSVSQTDDRWEAVLGRASVLTEQWGIIPPPRAVFVHAAHNLRIACRELPESDLHYELVRHVRARVTSGTIRRTDAFDVFTLSLGWRDASKLVRLLWPDAYDEYCSHEAALLNEVSTDDEEALISHASRREYASPAGIPYVRSRTSLTPPGEFAVSFPGGWTIGKTSVLCKIGRSRLLLDCGADQGGRSLLINPDINLLDAVLISHAHQDHIGGLFELYGTGVYDGPWYGLSDVGSIVELALADSIKLHQMEYGEKAVYDDLLLEHIMIRFVPVEPGRTIQVAENVSARAIPAGHVPASCQWLLSSNGKNLLFTGDFNTRPSLSAPALESPTPEEIANTIAVIAEGTYALGEGNLLNAEEAKAALLDQIKRAGSRPVLVPVLSLGRAQEVCLALAGTEYRVGVFGMAARMSEAILKAIPPNITFDRRRPEFVGREDYDVLVASSGCLQGGPSRVFHENGAWGPLPIILTGYLFPGTPAREIEGYAPRVRFSAHAPASGWREYIEAFTKAKIFLIHLPYWPLELPLPNVVVPRTDSEYRVGREFEGIDALPPT